MSGAGPRNRIFSVTQQPSRYVIVARMQFRGISASKKKHECKSREKLVGLRTERGKGSCVASLEGRRSLLRRYRDLDKLQAGRYQFLRR